MPGEVFGEPRESRSRVGGDERDRTPKSGRRQLLPASLPEHATQSAAREPLHHDLRLSTAEGLETLSRQPGENRIANGVDGG